MADNANHEGVRMWPSLETASWLYDWANIFLIGVLIIGAASTVLIVWMGNKKEEYLKRDLAAVTERAANAQRDAAMAQLQLEELRRHVAPRQLQREAAINALDGRPKARVEIVYLRDDPECFDVAQQIWQMLQEANGM